MNEDVTRLLAAIESGDPSAANDLLPLVYAELRKLARLKMAGEQPGQTLQPTALVHEAWLRLVGKDNQAHFQSRSHFFSAAGEAMRRLLVEAARRKLTRRRGGRQERLDIHDIDIAASGKDDELLAVHEALDRLAAVSPERAELVKLRYFAGLSIDEAALALGISERTAKRYWTFSRAWLFDEIRREY
ncbi:MAG TPA: sigma-70 family RNA polymerase sigma factor [Verrucomicrobiales bacterium]|jgi:RNA polymerase sigma factor (TIGR02999 family)|nr:sigma-70 family RNA polymerase sigma factor [Verrucomicrobiales bacterium]